MNCTHCERLFPVYDSLRKHVSRTHKIKSKDFFIEYKLNGIQPTCKCGCGEPTKFLGHGFRE